jgi:hypothetical protein
MVDVEKSQSRYTVEEMQRMATIASTPDGLSIEGNNSKVMAFLGTPNMLLFACEKILTLEHTLAQVKELAGRDSKHFGLSRKDIIERIDETTNRL